MRSIQILVANNKKMNGNINSTNIIGSSFTSSTSIIQPKRDRNQKVKSRSPNEDNQEQITMRKTRSSHRKLEPGSAAEIHSKGKN